MLGKVNEEHPRAMVLEAIRTAEKVAGQDNVEFVRALRASYFSHKDKRVRGKKRTVSIGYEPESEQDLKIFQDPRYARNARLLAERTKRRTKSLRIIGGVTVKGEDFPDCVAVGNDHEWGCSGTLIAPNAVLTAGHCSTVATRVCFGNSVRSPKKIIRVKKAIPHPDYRGSRHDLMVLILDTVVKRTNPRQIAPSTLIQGATDMRVVGFGRTDPHGSTGYGTKRMTDVPIASTSCEGTFQGEDDKIVYGCEPRMELIAGRPLLEKDTCKGDSGGPIYVSDSKGIWFLAGSTSRGTDLATYTCGDGGIYVRADMYRDWFESIPGLKLP